MLAGLRYCRQDHETPGRLKGVSALVFIQCVR